MRRLMICLCLLTVPVTAAAEDCDYSRPMNAELDATGASMLEIRAEAGFLVIEGDPTVDRVVVEGQACASKESKLDDIELDTDRKGNRLLVTVDIPDFGSSWRGYARLDLTVKVPAGLDLRVDDGSGRIDISNVASLDLEDGSGEIEIRDVAGDLKIDDGSGEIDVRDVQGMITLSDGSGSIELSTIGGGVRIREDGSGEIEIVGVRGDVEIDSDGSGGITVRDVTGQVRVGSDGSGSIWIAQVSGGFELGSDGSGTVHLDEVDGDVKMP